MADKFAVGEVCLIAVIPASHDNPHQFAPGDEVTVAGPLQIRTFGTGKRHWSYLVTRGDGYNYRALPKWLRKKPPKEAPREALGEWELCPWRPSHVTVGDEHASR